MKRVLLILLVALLLICSFVLASCKVEINSSTSSQPNVTNPGTTTNNTNPEPPPDAHHHVYETIEIPATCTEQGYTLHICNECGEKYTDNIVEPTGQHDYQSHVNEPTCTEQGFTSYWCDLCGYKYQDDFVEPTGKHVFSDWKVVTAPTCSAEGTQHRFCVDCGMDEYDIIARTEDHDIVREDGYDATCYKPGYTGGSVCHLCGMVFEYGSEIPALPHTYDDIYDKDCNKCGTIREDAACRHSNTRVLRGKDATCFTDGRTEGLQCTDCNEIIIEQIVIEKLGHDYTAVVTAPTCTAGGYTTYSCTRCSNKVIDDKVPSKGHSMSDWIVTIPPTCLEVGEQRKDCSECDFYIVNVLSALGHKWQAPTCSSPEICLNCDLIISPIIDCIESDYIITKAATKTENGSAYTQCTMCKKLMREITLYATGSTRLTYVLNADGNSYTLSGYGKCRDTEVIIPEMYNNLPVTAIGKSALSGNKEITSISIPKTVTYIDESAFYGCSTLKTVTLHDGITFIGAKAFYGCTSLSSITIPKGVTKIEDYSFYYTGLTSLSIPSHVKNIGEGAFSCCESLKNLTIENGTTSIGQGAFYSCDSLTRVSLPDSITELGEGAFNNCQSLISIKLSKNITTVSGFNECGSLTSISIPSGVTSVSGFYRCTSLTSVSLPNTVTDLNGFNHCYSLKEINIPNSVITIGGFSNCTNISRVVMPDSVKIIWGNSFSNCYSLTQVTLGSGLEDIKDDAFRNCYALYEICNKSSIVLDRASDENGCITYYGARVITDESQSRIQNINDFIVYKGDGYVILLRYIGDNDVITLPSFDDCPQYTINSRAFYMNDVVSKVTVPEGVTGILNYVFSECKSLTVVNLPASVSLIDRSAFNNSNALTAININSANEKYKSINGVLYSKNGTQLLCYPKSKPDTHFTIPHGVLEIASGTFDNCRNLVSVTIPDSVTKINGGAFSQCYSLSSVNIPSSVKEIGDRAFYSCDLKTITIPSSVTIIGSEAFRGCMSLTEIVLPNTLTHLGDRAFYNCRSLKSVTIPNSITELGFGTFYECTSLTSIKLPDNLECIGAGAFAKCSALTSINIPSSVKTIENNAFEDCTSLKEITVPDGITELGFWFAGKCFSLITINIPKSVTSISYNVIYRCESLKNINYAGTVEEWNAIKKDKSWDSSSGDYTIYCTDGSIAKDGTITYK